MMLLRLLLLKTSQYNQLQRLQHNLDSVQKMHKDLLLELQYTINEMLDDGALKTL